MATSAAAPARVRKAKLSRDRALKILNAMPRLVAASNTLIRPGTIVVVAYEVSENDAVYVFSAQPFRVLREISFREYFESLPTKLKYYKSAGKHHYEIATD